MCAVCASRLLSLDGLTHAAFEASLYGRPCFTPQCDGAALDGIRHHLDPLWSDVGSQELTGWIQGRLHHCCSSGQLPPSAKQIPLAPGHQTVFCSSRVHGTGFTPRAGYTICPNFIFFLASSDTFSINIRWLCAMCPTYAGHRLRWLITLVTCCYPPTFQGTNSQEMHKEGERTDRCPRPLLSFLALVLFSSLAIQSAVRSGPMGLQIETRQNYMFLFWRKVNSQERAFSGISCLVSHKQYIFILFIGGWHLGPETHGLSLLTLL